MNNYPMIEANRLGVKIGKKVLLHDISFHLKGLGAVALVGPSGGGKSTLASAITRLHDDARTQWRTNGYLAVNGLSVDEWTLTELRRYVGLVLQAPIALPTTIGDNLVIPQRLVRRIDKYTAERRALTSLTDFGLSDQSLKVKAHNLSGGQQQRLAMARAMLLEPGILILDEPTSALDPQAAAEVQRFLMDISKRTLLIIVTHDIGLARTCKRVLFLKPSGDEGATISVDGPPEAVFDNPVNEEEFRFARIGYENR